jgi:hypothetical protein
MPAATCYDRPPMTQFDRWWTQYWRSVKPAYVENYTTIYLAARAAWNHLAAEHDERPAEFSPTGERI